MNTPIIPVVLCGGSGTRLWPLSREQYPKQLLSLLGENTLLQDTLLRCASGQENFVPPMLICNEDHRFLVAEQARKIGVNDANIILEPCGRNTAPAVAIAANLALQQHDDAYLVVLPSDHVIADTQAFHASLADAITLANEGKLVSFGIEAVSPETGYGYLKRGQAQGCGFTVDRFVEKPDLETATEYCASGDYFWNSGMFVFKAKRFLEELTCHRLDIAECVERACAVRCEDNDFQRIDAAIFETCPAESIDYAVMEKTNAAAMVSLRAGWSDIGSWSALWDVADKNAEGNVTRGDVLLHDTSGSYVHAEHRLVSAVGMEDVVIVETADAVVVAPKNRAQEVKNLVGQLKSNNREERLTHRKVYRPWGHYESIDAGPGFQVKRISVTPGAKLSLQKHYHRAEHWIVVSGTAEVTCGERVFQLTENQSTYIPLGEVHRLANPGSIPLEIIEVQSGSYLGEDDIVRYDDNYGRSVAA